jgi:hypothetical protein
MTVPLIVASAVLAVAFVVYEVVVTVRQERDAKADRQSRERARAR